MKMTLIHHHPPPPPGVEILTHAEKYSKTNTGLIMSNFSSVYIQIQKSSEKVALKNTYPYHFKHKS